METITKYQNLIWAALAAIAVGCATYSFQVHERSARNTQLYLENARLVQSQFDTLQQLVLTLPASTIKNTLLTKLNRRYILITPEEKEARDAAQDSTAQDSTITPDPDPDPTPTDTTWTANIYPHRDIVNNKDEVRAWTNWTTFGGATLSSHGANTYNSTSALELDAGTSTISGARTPIDLDPTATYKVEVHIYQNRNNPPMGYFTVRDNANMGGSLQMFPLVNSGAGSGAAKYNTYSCTFSGVSRVWIEYGFGTKAPAGSELYLDGVQVFKRLTP